MKRVLVILLGPCLALAQAHAAAGPVTAKVGPPTNQPAPSTAQPAGTPSAPGRGEARQGELRVAGAFVDRIMLKPQQGAPLTLDVKPAALKVPAGTYTLTEVRLKQGDVEAAEDLLMGGRSITVKENAVTTLAVGGPLTNTVAVSVRGRFAVLSHRLLGVDGGTYRLTGPGRTKPPEFAIYRGDRRIASGKFEFG
jgi:hypothetical protein